jgi:hypothetical protein
MVSGILAPGAGEEIGCDADGMGTADDPAEEAWSGGCMQPGFGAICELRDDIKHLRTDRRQWLTEGGKRGGIVVSGHMAGGYRLPKPGRKPGSFLKQRCNCRHADPPAADVPWMPSTQAVGACSLADLADAVLAAKYKIDLGRRGILQPYGAAGSVCSITPSSQATPASIKATLGRTALM